MKTIRILLLICLFLLLFTSCKVSESNNETESVSYYIPTIEEKTLAYQINDNKVNLSTISFYIPQNFEPKDESGELLLKSKESTVEISVEDVTESAGNFDEYIKKTIDSLTPLGLPATEVEETDLGNFVAKRFSVDTVDITSTKIKIFEYFIETNTSKIVVNIISKNGEIVTPEQADEFIKTIDFV